MVDMATHLFPDVSNNQNVIDGLACKQEGMSAIAFKVSEGSSFVDNKAAANHDQAVRNGLDAMGYHFMDSGNGAAQAQHFVNCLAAFGGLGLPVNLDREGGSAADVDAFVRELRLLLPHNTFSAYSASWANSSFGQSGELATLPLWWSNYVGGSGTPQQLLNQVTPGWFSPFGGFSKYAARQYSSSANVGGLYGVDISVAFDDASYTQLFGTTSNAVVTPAAPVIPEEAMFQNYDIPVGNPAKVGDSNYAKTINLPPANYGQYGDVWVSFSCDFSPVALRVFVHQEANSLLNSPDTGQKPAYWYGIGGAPNAAGYFTINPDDDRLPFKIPAGVDKISVLRMDTSTAPASIMVEALHP